MDVSELRRTLDRERARGLEAFASATSLEELEAASVSILGRRSALGDVQRSLGSLEEEQRRELGKLVNETRQVLTDARDARRAGLEGAAEAGLLAADALDLSLPGRRAPAGSLHPMTLVENEIVEVFLRLGFRVAEGPEIEDDWHNFEALNIPQDHPARTMRDTLYVSIPGHPELLLRTET
jgi:phenylalanyl-tRNA synthetase alpha chain